MIKENRFLLKKCGLFLRACVPNPVKKKMIVGTQEEN
jgi:hypothetical protein